ncbi:MAG: hypothetical protein OIF57_00955, partial [Marinobacterium sp.]|nr:hypothetical protein [Marinobacterium sp.]
LKGQEMIQNARVKNLIKFQQEFSAAYFFYQDMYRFLPGDDPGADRFDNVAANQVGDGDGDVEGNWRGANDESVLAWRHLVASGLLGGAIPPASSQRWGLGAPIPTNVFGGVAGFEFNTGELGIPVLCFNNLEPEIALQIDLAVDDGVLWTGDVYATDMAVANAMPQNGTFTTNANALCFEI